MKRPSEPELDKDKPLAAAQRRLGKPGPKVGSRRMTEAQQGVAVGMAAAGIPQQKIAAALEVTRHELEYAGEHPVAGMPEVQSLREKLKLTKMRRAYQLEDRMWNLAEAMVEQQDAKGLDGTMRAIHASEKIQQVASGEHQKVDVVTQGTQPAVELTALIQVLLGDKA